MALAALGGRRTGLGEIDFMVEKTTQDGPQTAEDLRHLLLTRYRNVRQTSTDIASPLSAEDQQVQSMPDVSPTKWHLAHVTWFFETFLLKNFWSDYDDFDPAFGYLFNSYYEAFGPRHTRPRRGLLTRPTLEQVLEYRNYVDRSMTQLIETCSGNRWQELEPLVTLGLHHEQQHQELMLMDIKHVLSCNPIAPAYDSALPTETGPAAPLDWLGYGGGLHEVGHQGSGFAFDNEGPRHKVYLEDFEFASRPVTNGEYLDFIEDGGYREPRHWLMDGFGAVAENDWSAPLYWHELDGEWQEFTLAGMRPLDRDAPVSHVSYYEAAAFADWAGKRLPTEEEWEVVAETTAIDPDDEGNLLARGHLHPEATTVSADHPVQIYGDVWEWTRSAYSPYPGYYPPAGAIGEYNGKFMSGQMVLRGGCCATPPGHVRSSYRNFFYPHQRWMFSGIRLASEAG
jgi:ergothioneine biosynthesis protein EgtB